MDPTKTPLEALQATPARRAAVEVAIVGAAWADYHDEIYAFLVRTVRDADAAEDLLQEAYLRLTRQVRAFDPPDNLRAWLYRVAANLAVSRGRRIAAGMRGLARLMGRQGAARVDEAPEAHILDREARHELVALFSGLSPTARAALLMSSEGFTGAEIALAIGRSESATRTLLCRARIQLRHGLETREAAS